MSKITHGVSSKTPRKHPQKTKKRLAIKYARREADHAKAPRAKKVAAN